MLIVPFCVFLFFVKVSRDTYSVLSSPPKLT